ncbi:hypothetical protein [Klebsiella michiganensis]|uniref:hypothetical protein n=1 Tax=Klebsiella michiganensis TaxID=1134687 RepID=UPI00249B8304|nr:hypothetical protein [Klebsiella michiganensis]MDI3222428.1 hypothetical protein [Klebsiella michiganensis]
MNEPLKPAEVKSPLDDYLRIAKNQNAEGLELSSKLSAILLSLRGPVPTPTHGSADPAATCGNPGAIGVLQEIAEDRGRINQELYDKLNELEALILS